MSFAYKTLKGSDTTQAPYVANKQYTFPSSSLSSSNIVVYTGEYDPQYIISGTVYNAFDPINDTQDNGYYRRLIFDSIQKLYYQNYISGSQSGMFFVSSAYDNYDQTTLVSGAMDGAVVKILNNFTASGGKYGTDYYDTASYAILSPTKIRVISIPQDIYGNGIKPDTFIISSSTYYIKDDGQGNLWDYLTSGSLYNQDPYNGAYYAGTDSTKIYVGNIVYSPGFAIITNPDYLCFYPSNPIARNDNYTILNVSDSKVLPILDNDYDDCKDIDDNTIMTYPLDGFTFPSFSIVGGEIHITDCGLNNLQVAPGTYKILYTVNNTEGVVSNKATCSLYLQSNKFTSSLISYTSGCFNEVASQSVTFSLDLGIPPYSWSLNNTNWNGFSGCPALYQPIVSLSVPTNDNVNVYLKDVEGTIISYSFDTRMLPIIPNSSHLDTCLNASTGWISASATGGDPVNTLSASIQSGSYNSGYFPLVGGSYVFTGLNSGSYTVTWKDGHNCTTQSTEVITVPPPIVVSVQSVEADCPSDIGTPNGGIAVNVSGGSGNYNYRWWNGSSFVKFVEDPTGLPAGTYNLYVSDSTGCNSTTSSNIVVNALTVIGFSGATITSPLCYGNGNGSILGGTLSGGSGSLIPTWNGPSGFTSNSVNIINLAAGDYYLTASDTATGCYHIFGPYTITQPAEFKSSSFTYVGGGGIRTFRAAFTGGTPPYTASLYLSSSTLGLIFVTSSSGTGTIPMIPDVCYTQDTYWTLDGYDNNGCHMTNYMSGAQLYVPTQVTQMQPVCYATTSLSTLCNCSDVGGTMEYTTFYMSASDTTDPYALINNYYNLQLSHSIVYEDCKLTTPVPYGDYWNNGDGTVAFSGSVATPGNGEIIGDDLGCLSPIKQVSIHIQNANGNKTTSTTYYSSSFVAGSSPLSPIGYTVLLNSFNAQTTNYYTIAQTGYLNLYGEMQQALSIPGCCVVQINVTSGSVVPDSTTYQFFYDNSETEVYNWFAGNLFIDSAYNYNVDIILSATYNCI